MAWEEYSCISLNMQLIAILSRIGVMIGKSTPSSEKKVSMPYIIKLNSYTDANKLTINFVQPVCLHIIRICSDSRIQIKGGLCVGHSPYFNISSI